MQNTFALSLIILCCPSVCLHKIHNLLGEFSEIWPQQGLHTKNLFFATLDYHCWGMELCRDTWFVETVVGYTA